MRIVDRLKDDAHLGLTYHMTQIMVMADIIASTDMDVETGAKYLSKFAKHHMILKPKYDS